MSSDSHALADEMLLGKPGWYLEVDGSVAALDYGSAGLSPVWQCIGVAEGFDAGENPLPVAESVGSAGPGARNSCPTSTSCNSRRERAQ